MAAARLILAESLWLSCGGIAVGAVLAIWGTAFVRGVLLDGAGAAGVLQFDLPLFLASAALVGTSALVSGLAPALAASHSVAWNALRAGGRARGGSPLRDRLLGLLVVAQIAVALVLANGAVMLTASYRNVWRENRALRGSRAVTAGVALAGARYETPEARARFWQAFLARVRALPGVKAAAVTSKLPLEGGNNGSFLVEGETYDAAARRPLIERSAVSPDYFGAMGLHFLQGGTLRPAGNDARIVDLVVNQAFVDRYWRGQSALGRSVFPNAADPAWKGVVVGVIENVRQWGADAPPMPEVYVDYGFWSRSNASLVVSPARAPAQLLPSVRAQLAAVDRDLALSRVRLMEDVIGESTRSRRRLMQLIDAFMLAALVIAALGVYGTLSHAVTRRRGEIGIRMAVGAEPRAVVLDVIRMARGWIVSGLVLGIAGALGSARLAHSALFGVKAIEPLGTSLVTLAVAATLLAACWLPARRAARVDPMEALRCE